MNTYLEEHIVRERIAEARAFADLRRLVHDVAPACHPIRATLGHALIRVGHWVAGGEQSHAHGGRATA